MKTILQSSLEYSLGPVTLYVSKCNQTSVSYITSQLVLESIPTSIQKGADGSLVVPWEAFGYTLNDYFCHDDPAVLFYKYYLNVTNYDSKMYPDISNSDCIACTATSTCGHTECLTTTVAAIYQNKLMSFNIHIIIGTSNS